MIGLTIAIVAEGPTDISIIKAIVRKVIPGDHRFLNLQPDLSRTSGFGAYGGGWKGVVRWCKSIPEDFGDIHKFMIGLTPAIDLLVIHVDADIAREQEISCYFPCPPVRDTVTNIEKLILQWLKETVLSNRIVFCIPADNTEAWILYAYDQETPFHNPPVSFLECLKKPDYEISKQGYNRPNRLLKRRDDGKPKKVVRDYENMHIPVVLSKWDEIKTICFQARSLEDQLRRFITG